MRNVEFKICVVACNGSRVVVSHQIFKYHHIHITHYMHINEPKFIEIFVKLSSLVCSPVNFFAGNVPFDSGKPYK